VAKLQTPIGLLKCLLVAKYGAEYF
jgi:hypothetical protein